MFQYDIDTMRRSIERQLSRGAPIRTVLIKQSHAEYLGVRFITNRQSVRRVSGTGIVEGQKIVVEPLVRVDYLELYNAVLGAVGVERKNQQTRIIVTGTDRKD